MPRPEQDGVLSWRRVRGRNGYDNPLDLPADQAAEVLNMELTRGGLGGKRRGASAQTLTGDAFSGYNKLSRFSPGQSDTAAELFIVSRDATPKILRVAGGTAASALTVSDAIASRPQDASMATLNGKHYIAYDSSVDRLHCWDGSTFRRVGLQPPGVPTVANTGSGSYAATIRYYRERVRTKSGSRVVLESEPSASVSFTPSGSGTAARVTKASATGDGETHWVVEGSPDNLVFYELAEIAVGTTTYDDSAAPSTYANNTVSAEEGSFTTWPSVKYLLAVGNRLIGYGVWESQSGITKNGRVYFSPVLGSTDTDDDERVSNSDSFEGFLDVARNSGREDRGIAGPIDGVVYVFQSRGIQMLLETAQADLPYRRVPLTESVGAIEDSFVMAPDESGRPAIYFLDEVLGPHRLGANGLEWMGHDSKDIWDTFNIAAANKRAHGIYHAEKRQVIWWIATGSADDPNQMLMIDLNETETVDRQGVRYGQCSWTGDLAGARCSVMFARTLGASMSRNLTYFAGTASKLYKGDISGQLTDDGTAFQAYATSQAFTINPLHVNKQVMVSYLGAKCQAATSIQQSITRNYGDETNRTSTASIAASGSETRTIRKFEDSALQDAWTFQVTLGDASAVASAWQLDFWLGLLELKQAR